MPKFFVKANQIENNEIKIIGEDVKHIGQVLRAKEGEKVTICNIDERVSYITKIAKITPEYVLCTIETVLQENLESKIDITVFQGLPKADKMEYIIQKNTELGVKKFVPVAMKRSIVKLDEKEAKKKVERWQKIAESAAKQSGRDFIPKVEMPINVLRLSEEISRYDIMVLAYEEEKENTLKNELKKITAFEGMKIGVIIGPEGGIDKSEIDELKGSKIVSLGKRILRTETASIVMVSNIIYEYEM